MLKVRAALFALAGVAVLVASGCGSNGPSKAEYIKKLDTRCAAFEKKAEAEGKKFGEQFTTDPQAGLVIFKKLVADAKAQDKAWQKEEKPSDDKDVLDQFWKKEDQVAPVLDDMTATLTKLVAIVDKAQNGTDTEKQKAQKDALAIQTEFSAFEKKFDGLAKEVAALAKKYGFKKCGITNTGFSGQSR